MTLGFLAEATDEFDHVDILCQHLTIWEYKEKNAHMSAFIDVHFIHQKQK